MGLDIGQENISFAKEYVLLLDGYVVSDNHKTDEMINGIYIYELKGLIGKQVNNLTFVLGIELKKRDEIRAKLNFHGFCSILG